eukprot:6081356-Prymnesium_polylepis.1
MAARAVAEAAARAPDGAPRANALGARSRRGCSRGAPGVSRLHFRLAAVGPHGKERREWHIGQVARKHARDPGCCGCVVW